VHSILLLSSPGLRAAMPRVHQLEYAKTYQDVTNNVDELIVVFFEQCASADKSSGKLAAIEKQKKNKGEKVQKEKKPSNHHRGGRRDHRAKNRDYKSDNRNSNRDE
jgi:hypothetical protein